MYGDCRSYALCQNQVTGTVSYIGSDVRLLRPGPVALRYKAVIVCPTSGVQGSVLYNLPTVQI